MSKLISYLQLGGVALIVGQLSYIIVNNQTNITNQNNTAIHNTDAIADNEDSSSIKNLLEEIMQSRCFLKKKARIRCNYMYFLTRFDLEAHVFSDLQA